MTGIGEEYECANCHGTFHKTWSDEEAYAEMETTWNIQPGEELDIICDNCYQQVLAWAHTEAPDTLTEAEYLASLPQRMADVAETINTGLADVLPEGMRFEWKATEEAAPAVRGNGIRVCFCDLNGRPSDDWDAHESFCLMLDWAAANGKITPGYWLQRLEGSQAELGITDEEIAAEARLERFTIPDTCRHVSVHGGRCAQCGTLCYPVYSLGYPARPRYDPPEIPSACYRSEYGFMVHVKDACRCK